MHESSLARVNELCAQGVCFLWRRFDLLGWLWCRCVVHDGRLKRDHSTYMLHHEFRLDFALDENATDQHVWEEAAPLLRHVQGGGRATLMLFGQTGTGRMSLHRHEKYQDLPKRAPISIRIMFRIAGIDLMRQVATTYHCVCIVYSDKSDCS